MPEPRTPIDNGNVIRTREDASGLDGGWTSTVEYRDESGNRMTIQRGGSERGGSDSYSDTTVRCANGATVPEDKHAQLNKALRDGFWFPDTLSSLFPVRDHDFGDTNPLKDACAIAPKPRAR